MEDLKLWEFVGARLQALVLRQAEGLVQKAFFCCLSIHFSETQLSPTQGEGGGGGVVFHSLY